MHYLSPAAQVTDVKRMKINFLDRQRQFTHSKQDSINLFGITSDILQIWTQDFTKPLQSLHKTELVHISSFQNCQNLLSTIIQLHKTNLKNIAQILTDWSHVICPLKESSKIKFPARRTPRLFYFSTHFKVWCVPLVQNLLGITQHTYGRFFISV